MLHNIHTPRLCDRLSVFTRGREKKKMQIKDEGRESNINKNSAVVPTLGKGWTLIFHIKVVCLLLLSPLPLAHSPILTLGFSASPTTFFVFFPLQGPFSDRKRYRHYRSLDTVRRMSKKEKKEKSD